MARSLKDAPPSKLAKKKETAPTKKTRELITFPKEKEIGGLKRRTFMLHDDDVQWLEQTTKKLKNTSPVVSFSKSALIRLGINLLRDELREKDMNEILERIKIE